MPHVRLTALSAIVLLCTSGVLLHTLDWNFEMRSIKGLALLVWHPLAVASQNVSVDLNWYPPMKSWINDLGHVLNGSDTHGFIFNNSQLPAGTPYGTYNWCNMPHVRSQEYMKAKEEFQLLYVEV